ncbi:MAG TPA: GlsB/YeaQ/YmgE family stress response membrane protein [Chloroflexota bacterium]|nr:GlsB/YeaQ/YmgE family stress response membrane protein [Chloroflexota bacterium]
MALDPGGIIMWLVVGALAGWLAGQFMKGSGYGVVGNIIMGVLGALVGGFIATALGFGGTMGIIGTTVVAFIGAVILIAAVRALPGRSPV